MRVLRLADRTHILVALANRGNEEDKAIAAIWRRVVLRIPDVRFVDSLLDADLAIVLSAREVRSQDHSVMAYVWHAKIVQPCKLDCAAPRETYYLEQPQIEFMNYAASLGSAGEMIQKSVNSIEDTQIQLIREEKRR